MSIATEPSIYSPQPVYHPNVRSPSLRSQTLSDYGSPGKSSSLAPPGLTRGSSATTSSTSTHPPVTPSDDIPHEPGLGRNNTVTRYYSAESSYGRDFPTSKDKAVGSKTKLRPAAQTERIEDRAAAQVETARRYDVPLGQSIIATGSNTLSVVAPRMQRHRSAKELIDQCEQRDSSARASTPPSVRRPQPGPGDSLTRRNAQLPPVPLAAGAAVNPPRAPASHCVPEGPSYFSSFARSRGKLRDSFTNLVQLLGEKAKARDRDKDSLNAPATAKRNSISPSVSRTFGALPKGFKLKLGKRTSLGGGGMSPSGSPGRLELQESAAVLDIHELLATEPQKTGLLLYQSPIRQCQPTTTTPWMPYTVSLYPTSLVLEIPNPRLSMLSSSKFQISLLEMYDVHSVEAKELLPGFVVPPTGFRFDEEEGDGELYVFEVGSYGGSVERFAAGSARTRKEWVVALMDAISRGDNLNGKQEHTKVPFPSARPLPSPTPSRVSTSIPAVTPGSPFAPSLYEARPSEPQKSAAPTITPGLLPGNTTSRTASVLPNPWDPPQNLSASMRGPPAGSVHMIKLNTTSTRTASPIPTRLTSASSEIGRSSTPVSHRSERTMTASPSISRLDERSLVKNRLAMLERQTSPSPSPRPGSALGRGVRPGSVGPINWEALAKVRGTRGGSGLSSRTGGRPDSGLSMRGTVSGLGEHRPLSILSGRASEFNERANTPVEIEDPPFKPRWPFPTSGDTPNDERPGAIASLLSRLAIHENNALSATADSPPVQILGNLPPRGVPARPLSRPLEPGSNNSFNLVSDRIASLTAALRESDVAHSTKASGLGQLVASAQGQILQAVEESTQVSSREHVATIGHLERLQEAVHSLAPKAPDAETQLAERMERLAMKEALERVDRGVAEQVVVTQKLDGLKEAVDDMVGKLGGTTAHDSILAKLETVVNRDSTTLSSTLLEEISQQIKAHISSLDLPGRTAASSQLDMSEMLAKLDAIAAAVAESTPQVDLSEIKKTLEEIRGQRLLEDGTVAPNPGSAPVDMSDVLMKLDGVSAMCQSFMEAKAKDSEGSQETEGLKQEANEKLMQLLAALREDAEHRTTQAEQTAELVRYSNELNAWLEKFVTNASMQMDNVGAGLGVLRRDLGLDPPLATEDQAEARPPPHGTLQQVRATLEEQVKSMSGVTATLNSLATSINEARAQDMEARQQMATDAVLKMIELQRQEQERLLRKLATDLSSDIRGERIRFVEAMSKATAMNIQVHVEEFKKQLTREVIALTDEVGRLREERKTIQHQIAQLFLIKTEHETENGISSTLVMTEASVSGYKHLPLVYQRPPPPELDSMLSTRFHDDVNVGGRFPTKTPGRAGANLGKENPGGRGGAQTTLTGKGQERTSKNVPNTPGYNDLSQFEPQRLFKGGKVDAQQTQSISRAFALLDKTNKTPHPKSRKAVSIMTPVAGSAQKPSAKPLFAPTAPQATDNTLQNTVRRPSSGRLSIRAPSSVVREFKTPDARGRRAHWDVGDMDPSLEMDNNVDISNSIKLDNVEVEEEDELEYMPPTAIIPDYQPMFDMPDMQAFGQAVRSLTYSHWPRDDVDILSTIRDDEVVDSCINDPSFHDLSMLDPPEDDPFPPRKGLISTLKPLDTRGRPTALASGKGPKSAPHTRPVSVAAVRTVSSSGAPKSTTRPVSVTSNRSVSVAGVRPPPAAPPKVSRTTSTEASQPPLRRPGTAPGIRPGEGPARVAGKMMVPKAGQAKPVQQQPLETHVVEALAMPVNQLALDDEFMLEL
ncbi:hypothetical protein FRC07_006978 [Ceratobasidium sp. 392]|nr:hypothetical protein FRC07_006978 [Ceratobasidium sp. 392]